MAVDERTLAALPIFSDLDAHQRSALAGVLVERVCAPDEVAFVSGEPAVYCAFIVAGIVHVEVDVAGDLDEPTRRINTMGPGEIFGEVALLDGQPRSASCVAGDAGATLALLSRDDFAMLFEAGSSFAFAMVRLIARHLAERVQRAVFRFRWGLLHEPPPPG